MEANQELQQYVQTREEAFIRDKESGALINQDLSAYARYKQKREMHDVRKQLLARCVSAINSMQDEINTIKNQLKRICDNHQENGDS